MGADGGLTWMYLRDPKRRARAIQLISPFGFLGDKLRNEDSAYLWEHPLDIDEVIIARYGTDLDHDGMRELYEILAYKEIDGRTFEDVALDLATRPDWLMHQIDTFERAVVRACDPLIWFDYYRTSRFHSDHEAVVAERSAKRVKLADEDSLKRLGALRTLTVDDWADELKRLLRWERYETVETWT